MRSGDYPGETVSVIEPVAVAPRFKSLSTFVGEYEPLAYAIDPIVRSGSLYSVTGKTGSGKTALLVAIAFAVASGRADILGRKTERGGVAYVALENPDDTRMRFMVTADRLSVSIDELGDTVEILDHRVRPDEITDDLAGLGRPLGLVVIDTFAALFDGKNVNDAVEAGDFTRRLRPLTRLAGRPAVLLACHPVKNAQADSLVPYGSGAILNEVDGNLTLWKEGNIATLHWQGKLRGLEFPPVPFRFDPWESSAVLDANGGRVRLPVCVPSSDEAIAERRQASADRDALLLRAMLDVPDGTQREWIHASGHNTGSIGRALSGTLATKGYVEQAIDGKWRLTKKGKKEAEALSAGRDNP